MQGSLQVRGRQHDGVLQPACMNALTVRLSRLRDEPIHKLRSMRAAMPASLALYVDRIAKLRSRMASDGSAQSQSMLEVTMRVRPYTVICHNAHVHLVL